MAKLPQFKDFRKEDYQEAPGWFGRFLQILNSFTTATYQALNAALTFGENIRAQIKELTFTTRTDYSTLGWDAIQFNSTFPKDVKVQGVFIMQILTTDQLPIVDLNGQVANWNAENSVVSINYISGLANSKSYTVRFLVI